MLIVVGCRARLGGGDGPDGGLHELLVGDGAGDDVDLAGRRPRLSEYLREATAA